MDPSDLKHKIFFYCKDKYYMLMLSSCNEALAQNSNNISLHFYHALALTLCSRYQESIRKLESLQSEADVKLAVVVALYYSYKLMGNEDHKTFNGLETRMRELRKQANAIDYYNTAFAMLAFRKFEKCYDYAEKSLLVVPETDAFNIKGWALLHLHYLNIKQDQSTTTFEESLQRNAMNIAAALGLSQAYLIHKDRDMSMNSINKAVVRFPNSVLPLIEKMKILFSLQDWDQTIETYNRVLQNDSNNLEALRVKSIILIIKDANYEEGTTVLRNYFVELEKCEARNAKIFFENATLFARICGRNRSVLNECTRIIEKALQIYPNNANYIAELANQNYLANKIKEATRLYKSAIKINDANVSVLMGMTLCEMAESGKIENVKQQVEFLTEFQENTPTPLLFFMQAKVAQNTDVVIGLLRNAYEYQMKEVKSYPYSPDYLRYLNPDFLLEVVKELVKYTPQSNMSSNKTILTSTPVFDLIEEILKSVTYACPGLKEALFLLAKAQFIKSEYSEAAKTLQHIINDLDITFIDAHILLSHIQIKMNMYERAAQNLEVALSHNFAVRDYPYYHLIIGLVEKYRGNTDNSVKAFGTALSLANKAKTSLSLAERATIYMELIEAHLQLKQVHEATKLMQEAMLEFEGTPEEARITILTANHALEKNNVQQAIDLLNKIAPSEPYYLEAKTKLANIYLKHRRDKRSYLQCYQEIVENTGTEGLVSLGDAYMHILEPDLALDAYQKALNTNPKDPFLTSKMGTALVHTHHFARAINYYKETIATTGDPKLKIDLIELYVLLKQYENAEKMINEEIEMEKNKKLEDLTALKYKTKLLVLLAEVLEKSSNYKGAQSKLKEARDNQNRVRRLYTMEQTVIPQEETDQSVEISLKLAEISKGLRENELAINHYKDALKLSLNNIKILIALAKQYMQMNYLDMCQQTCTSILNIDLDNEEASVMMADIAFRKMDFDMAQFHFIQLLNKQPTNWTALVRLVEIMRRTGTLDDVPQYLKKAEQNCNQTVREPGVSFAKGLYEWYTGNLNAALRDFNNVRLDSQWGHKAIINMIDICLNPDDEMFGDQFVDDDADYRDSRSMALNTAQRLLTELTVNPDLSVEESLQCRLLNNFLMIATKDKSNVEQALEDLISMAQRDPEQDHIGTTLAIANAYTVLKQGQRAKNQLKRVVKRQWTFEDAEYLERCWLHLGDLYMQASKYDLAADLLKRVLQYNKSSNKANEYMGYIAEKEQRYKEASTYLETAWKYGGKNNPIVGYRLAFNLMKYKKYADAIDVCQLVLKNHPDYPKIKKDILDKCMNNLRT